MTSILNTALTGMKHSLRSIETTSRNIANLNTGGYRAQRYDKTTGTTQARYDASLADPEPDPEAPPVSDVDLATEFVDLKRHEIAYQANATLVSIADRLIGEMIDLRG